MRIKPWVSFGSLKQNHTIPLQIEVELKQLVNVLTEQSREYESATVKIINCFTLGSAKFCVFSTVLNN